MRPGGVEGDAPFNMAMLFYLELSKVRTKKAEAAISGDLRMYVDALEEIYTSIEFKLTTAESEGVRALLKRAQTDMGVLEGGRLRSHAGVMASMLKDRLREIDRALMRLMDKYKMIFPRLEVRGGLKGLEKRMGLGMDGGEEGGG